MYDSVILNFGYIESGHVGFMFYHNHKMSFDNKQDILRSLARNLYLKYRNDIGLEEYPICCKNGHDNNTPYCARCGQSQSNDPVDFDEGFVFWLMGLDSRSCDSYGYEHDDGWSPWDFDDMMQSIANGRCLIAGGNCEYQLLFSLTEDDIKDSDLESFRQFNQKEYMSWPCGIMRNKNKK